MKITREDVLRVAELANLDFSYNDIGRLLDQWTARMQQANAPK